MGGGVDGQVGWCFAIRGKAAWLELFGSVVIGGWWRLSYRVDWLVVSQ